jgi:hypothetical protein
LPIFQAAGLSEPIRKKPAAEALLPVDTRPNGWMALFFFFSGERLQNK